jgi:hypothetical protein
MGDFEFNVELLIFLGGSQSRVVGMNGKKFVSFFKNNSKLWFKKRFCLMLP